MQYLKQSTSVTVKLGPFLDETDGKTAETALTISQADIRLSKNGGNIAQSNDTGGGTHDELGYYDITLDATDTNTLGRLLVAVHESGALPVWREFMVLPAAVYDAMVSGTGDGMLANVAAISGDSAAADNLETMLDGTGGQTLSLGRLVVASSSNDSAVSITGSGSGPGLRIIGGGTSGAGVDIDGGAPNGPGLVIDGDGSGDGVDIHSTTGNGIEITSFGAYGISSEGTSGGIRGRSTSTGAGIEGLGGTGAGILGTGGSNQPGIEGAGTGSGAGLEVGGGSSSGHGLLINGGNPNGNGIDLNSGSNGDGIDILGINRGIDIFCAGGPAVFISSSSNYGFQVTGGLDGMRLQGGSAGAGLHAQGGAANGTGARFQGDGTGEGLNIIGGDTGHGLLVEGGLSGDTGDGVVIEAAPNGGFGVRIEGNFNPALDLSVIGGAADAIHAAGFLTGAGFRAIGGSTGHGFELVGGGTSGDGLNASVSGAGNSGFNLTGGGSGFGQAGTQEASGGGGGGGDELVSTTIATLASQTEFTLTAGSADDDAYSGAMIVVTDQSTATQKAVGIVSDYTGGSRTVFLAEDPGIFTMAVGDAVVIQAVPKQLPDAVHGIAGGLPTVDGSNFIAGIQANGITATSIAANAITSAKIATDAIGAAQIAANAITSSELADGTITAAKLGAGAITSTVLAANAIGASQIAANAITDAKINTGAITAAKFAANAVTSTVVADNTITAAKINTGALTAAKFAADSITASALATDAVNEIAAAITAPSVLASGTAQAGTASTIQLAASSSFADDVLNGNVVKITGGTGAGQSRLITDYVGGTDTATITPDWTVNPDNTSAYEVVPGAASAVQFGANSITAASLAADAVQELADGVLLRTNGIETGWNLRNSLRVILAANAGKSSGGGTGTRRYRDVNDTVNRIVATVSDQQNRTAVTLNAS